MQESLSEKLDQVQSQTGSGLDNRVGPVWDLQVNKNFFKAEQAGEPYKR